MKPIIEINKISKQYKIGEMQQYYSLRDSIENFFKSPFRKSKKDNFWALKDISFSVMPGEVIGIIGRNGAGKSTLLKILSQITPPTKGEIAIRGRVASLLEVGTGFHPELTGRENIYLNGAILGMRRIEIKHKFDQIVEFAELEKFLDTPVKHYSSGMYMRLAFAVAAHLEPEILIIDEVLAVGDIEFQNRCLGKMKEVSHGGRTVIFVSHNMNSIKSLCKSCLILANGQITLISTDVSSVINKYIGQTEETQKSNKIINLQKYCNYYYDLLEINLSDDSGKSITSSVKNDLDIWLNIIIDLKKENQLLDFGYKIYNNDNVELYSSYSIDSPVHQWPKITKGKQIIRTKLPKRLFNEGMFRIEIVSSIHGLQWLMEPMVSSPSIYLNIQGGLSDSPYYGPKRSGILAPIFLWESVQLK